MSESKPPRDALDLSLQVLWRLRPQELLRFGMGDQDLELVEVLNNQVIALRRTVDSAALVRGPHGIYLAHLEFETSPDAREIAARQYVYAAQLFATEHHRYPVRSTVVLVEDRLPELQPEFRMDYGPERWARFEFRIIRLRDLKPGEFLTDPVSAALVPFSAEAGLGEVEQAAKVIHASAQEREMRELLAALYIVAGRRFPRDVLRPLLWSQAVMESDTFNELIEMGEAKGIQKGLQKGLQKGQQKGLRKGRQKGRQEGMRRLVEQLFESRHGSLSEPALAKLNQIKDERALVRLAALAGSSTRKAFAQAIDAALNQ